MQGPKRCRGSMPQGRVGPHLPLTWTRFDYLCVPVPSTAGGARPAARGRRRSCLHRAARQRVVRPVVGLGVAHLQGAGAGRHARG